MKALTLFKYLVIPSLCLLAIPVWSELTPETNILPEVADIYRAPRMVDNPTPEMQACYETLASCMSDCDTRFPATLYETNPFFPQCIQICNKTANQCLTDAEAKKPTIQPIVPKITVEEQTIPESQTTPEEQSTPVNQSVTPQGEPSS